MRASDPAEEEEMPVVWAVKFSLICPPAIKTAPIMRKVTPKIASAVAVDVDDPEELDKPAAMTPWKYW